MMRHSRFHQPYYSWCPRCSWCWFWTYVLVAIDPDLLGRIIAHALQAEERFVCGGVHQVVGNVGEQGGERGRDEGVLAEEVGETAAGVANKSRRKEGGSGSSEERGLGDERRVGEDDAAEEDAGEIYRCRVREAGYEESNVSGRRGHELLCVVGFGLGAHGGTRGGQAGEEVRDGGSGHLSLRGLWGKREMQRRESTRPFRWLMDLQSANPQRR